MKYPERLNLKLFKENPTLFLENTIKEYVSTSPLNCMIPFNNQPMFGEPIVAFDNGDDPVFQNIKKTVAPYHLTPREVLESMRMRPTSGGAAPSPGGPPPRFDESPIEHVSVISGALPINPDIIRVEGQTRYGGSPRHKYTSWIGGHNGLLATTTKYIENLFLLLGYNAITPSNARFFESSWARVGETCRTTQSNWSERHVAELCGLGTFGLHGQIITPKGAAVHLFSIVCNMELTPTPKSGKENCLYYRDGSCKECIDRCFGGAISERGRNPTKCHLTAMSAVDKSPEFKKKLGAYASLIGNRPACGLCFSNVPCADRIPA
jgi:epoxyqueuosine reductase